MHTVLLRWADFEEFLERMGAEGYEVRNRGKSLEFRAPDQLRFTRSFCLGDEYTEEAMRERIAGRHKVKVAKTSAEKTAARMDVAGKKFDFLFDRIKQFEGRMVEVAQLIAEYAALLPEGKRSMKSTRWRGKR